MLSHSNLKLYYNSLFVMTQHFNYTISEIESMIPFERDIYMSMLADYLEKKREQKR